MVKGSIDVKAQKVTMLTQHYSQNYELRFLTRSGAKARITGLGNGCSDHILHC